MPPRTSLLISLLTLLSPPALAAPPLYNLTLLPPFPTGQGSWALDINNAGQVVGHAGYAGTTYHGFVRSPDGSMTELPALGGLYSDALAINESGLVVGIAGTNAYNEHAAFWTPASTTPTLIPVGDDSQATAVNNPGTISVVASNPDGSQYALLRSPDGTLTSLADSIAGSVYPASLNDSGTLVGTATLAGVHHAFQYSPAAGPTYLDARSDAYAINSSGQVVGLVANDPTHSRAFLWTNNTLTDLGSLGFNYSCAFGINSHATVVGESTTPDTGISAFVWSDGVMTDLNTLLTPGSPATHLLRAYAINDAGEIVGLCTTTPGVIDAFLLTPTPEPNLVTLLAPTLFLHRRKK